MKQIAVRALQSVFKFLARIAIQRYRPGIIGITGSVGKTSTKEAVRAVLHAERVVRASSKSFNNELGLPLAVLGDWDSTEGVSFWVRAFFQALGSVVWNRKFPDIIILEYGVDRPGDMHYLLSVAEPHVGIFTGMGSIPVHVAFFKNPEAIVREKAKLITRLPSTGFAVLNADDEVVFKTKESTHAHVVSYGFSSEANVRIMNFIERHSDSRAGISFKLSYAGSTVPVQIPMVTGKTHAYAAAAGAAVGLAFGMNLVKIAEALNLYRPAPGRLTIIPGIRGSILIDDTYNASPVAMQEALAALESFIKQRKIAVLGDMLELGAYSIEAHETVGKHAASVVDFLVTIGSAGNLIADAAKKAGMKTEAVIHCKTVAEAGALLQNKIQKSDVILFKASQGVRLEQAVLELMAEPQRAAELLVRQSPVWRAKPGLYD